MVEKNMRTFRIAFACTFAGALMACSVASLHAAPLPTNAEAMKSMVADSSIKVRWGGWRGGGLGFRGFGWGAGALAGAVIGGAIASSAYGYYGGPYYGYGGPVYGYGGPAYGYGGPAYGGYYPAYGYPTYGPYDGSWQAIQEPGTYRFYRPYW
jgi:hypothetical protein